MKQIVGLAIALIAFACVGLPGQEVEHSSRFTHSSGEVFDLAPSDQLNDFLGSSARLSTGDLIEIALIFSGVSQEHRVGYRSQILNLIADSKMSVEADSSPYEKGEAILAFLHASVFGRYDESQTYLDVLLDSGLYNCVSSSVLYAIFAREYGLELHGTITKDHAFCTLVIDDESIDVETTTPAGFDPGRKTEFFDSFGNLTGYSYVPPSNYRDRTKADERELFALILHNRISLLDAQERFRESLSLSIDRHAFLQTESTFQNIVREIGNLVAVLNRERRYDDALGLLDLVYREYGVLSELQRTHHGILNNLIVEQLRSNAFEAARVVLRSQTDTRVLPEETLSGLRKMVVQNELAAKLPALGISDGFALINSIRNEASLPDDVYREYELSLYARSAEETAEADGYLAAAAVIDVAIESLGPDSRLVRAREVYRYNFAASEHNRFAEYFNAGKLEEARQIVVDALEFTPDSTLLAEDLATVERILE